MFGIIVYNIISVKKEDSHRSEMVTQALFGETFTILEKKDEWTRVQFMLDGYTGWIMRLHYLETPKLYDTHFSLNKKDGIKIKIAKNRIHIPMGALIWDIESIRQILKVDEDYLQIPTVEKNQMTSIKNVLKTAKKYLGTPYLWGGKSTNGIDCSGLMQMAFMLNGYQLPRDAYQQAELGTLVDFENARKGDVAFFHNESGRIIHVGIIYSVKNKKVDILHSSGYVKIDILDRTGIQSDQHPNGYSHQLTFIKRMID